jgi:hypothetical protein
MSAIAHATAAAAGSQPFVQTAALGAAAGADVHSELPTYRLASLSLFFFLHSDPPLTGY